MIRKIFKETSRLEKKIGKKLGCQFGITSIQVEFDGGEQDSFISMDVCWNWGSSENGWHNGKISVLARNMNTDFLAGYILAQIEHTEIDDETK